MRKPIVNLLRVVGLTLIHLFLFVIIAGILSGSEAATEQEAGEALGGLLLAFVLETAVLSTLIWQARWSGWRLASAIFVLFYGVKTVMSQMETAVFLSQTHLTITAVSRIILIGLLVSLPLAFLSVLLLGRWRGGAPLAWSYKRHHLLVWAGLAGFYVLLYFIFGYAIAWQNPALRAYYGGQDWGSFGQHMLSVWRNTPWLIPFQWGRGFLWLGFVWLLTMMLHGSKWSVALLAGLTLAVFMTAQLLIPNPYMPETVRLSHLLETASSNFIFGWVAGWILLSGKRRLSAFWLAIGYILVTMNHYE